MTQRRDYIRRGQCSQPWPRYISQLSPNMAATKHAKQYTAYRIRSRSVRFVTMPSTTEVNNANSIAASKWERVILGMSVFLSRSDVKRVDHSQDVQQSRRDQELGSVIVYVTGDIRLRIPQQIREQVEDSRAQIA